MSASTLSVTANPSAPITRRRTSNIAGDVRQSIDILNESTLSPDMDDKDPTYTVREAVLERSSKDPAASKKSQSANPSPPLRSRNRKAAPVSKPAKPVWQTVLKLLTKRLSLLLVLVFLIEMVRRLVVNSGNGVGSGSLAGFSDMEGRIAVVESSLKTTAKMVQVQIEVVDKKVDSLVGDLKKDLGKKSIEIETRLRKLDERSEVLEAALDDLKSKDLLTRDDLVKLSDELVKKKGSGDVEVSLDEIRELAREIVEKEIAKHAADGLGMVDYALASAGATVVKHSEPLSLGKVKWLTMGTNSQGVHKDAEKMLKPSFGEPGQCFPLKGSSGFVQIRIRTAIVPEAITLEHVSKSVAYDRSSAPQDCRVSGWLQGRKGLDTELTTDSEETYLLTEFTYDLEKSNAQTFKVSESMRSVAIDTVKLEFTSNHGSPSHTCIYRLRVHGYEPSSVPMISSES